MSEIFFTWLLGTFWGGWLCGFGVAIGVLEFFNNRRKK